MANHRTTVILKTDTVDSTLRLAEQAQAQMGLQRKQHKQFISETAAKHRGSVFDEEGDAYWIGFPSVADAVLAALDMFQNLRTMQAGKGEKQRLAIRAVITAGDILYQENDTIGMVMSLTARLEKMTPPDEIYLSHAAWLLLNKAEVQTAFVGEFNFKGFSEAERIYKVEHKHRVRMLTNQFIVFTDLRGWTGFTNSNPIEEVENVLFDYDDILNSACDEHAGLIRNTSGDQYFLTFSEAESLFRAIEVVCKSWQRITDRYQLGLFVAIHRGDLNIIRSYLYSNDIHKTVFLSRLNALTHPSKKNISVVVSGRVKEKAKGTIWEDRFKDIDTSQVTDDKLLSIAKEYGAFQFIY